MEVEEPIDPCIDVNYTQLLIDGKFVESASGGLPFPFPRSYLHVFIYVID